MPEEECGYHTWLQEAPSGNGCAVIPSAARCSNGGTDRDQTVCCHIEMDEERARKECLALDLKVAGANRELAQWILDNPRWSALRRHTNKASATVGPIRLLG
jgi:hypothetical protein